MKNLRFSNNAEAVLVGFPSVQLAAADKLPEGIASEVRDAVGAVKSALEGTDVEAVKSTTATLNTVAQKIGEAVYAADQAAPAAEDVQDAPGDADEDVVDAEVVDEEDEKK